MKNIYFYIYPEKKFAPEYIKMSEIQIDNSLQYWNPKDIIVVTNFPWEYHGVKSIVVDSELYSDVLSHGTSLSNKPKTAIYLIENNLVDEINWFHDWDIFQLSDLNLESLDRDLGFVEYSYKPKIQLGSIFFKPEAIDVFRLIDSAINKYKQNEEETTNMLIDQNFNNILDRFKKLNTTYNIGAINTDSAASIAEKPLKIAHIPAYKPKYLHKSKKITPPILTKLLYEKFEEFPNIKNLLIYISPNKSFNPEHKLMLEAQIENSLDYWDKKDLILFTNFEYEFKGIKAIVGPDSLINKSYGKNKRGIINSKINAIIYMIENKIINGLTWFHDFDCFQLAALDLPSIKKDIALTCYGLYPKNRLTNLGKNFKFRINFGSVFFKPEAIDILKILLDLMDKDNLYEEDAMTILLDENKNDLLSRVQIMNQTYNIGMRYVRSNIANSEKPLRVAHFPPHDPKILNKFKAIIPAKLTKILDEKFTNIH